MRWILVSRLVALLVLGAAAVGSRAQDSRPGPAEPPEGAKRHLKDAGTFSVVWEIPGAWGPDTEIEVDSGRYNCCYEREPALEWYRIRRTGEGAEFLRIMTGGGNDSTVARQVRVARSEVSLADYRDLVRDLAWISSARLDRSEKVDFFWLRTGCSDWTYARLSDGAGTAWEDAWAGGTGSCDEIHYAKSRACVARIKEAVPQERFEPFVPSVEDRNRVLNSLSRRVYPGKPWEVFGDAEALTNLYGRLVTALDGEPGAWVPQPREEVEFFVGDRREKLEVWGRVTIRTVSGVEVSTSSWICRKHPSSFRCWTVRLEPGEYIAFLDVPAYEPRRYPITVRSGDPATVELELVKR